MVYVVQEQYGKNVLPASKYGKIIFLLKEGSQVTFSAGYVTEVLRSKLDTFCDQDYLLLIGDPVAIGIAVAMAAHWNQGRVKMLKWDKQKFEYYPVSINLFNSKKEDENELN